MILVLVLLYLSYDTILSKPGHQRWSNNSSPESDPYLIQETQYIKPLDDSEYLNHAYRRLCLTHPTSLTGDTK